MQNERNASFPVELLTDFLAGGKAQRRLLESIMLQLERDPVFAATDAPDLSLQETRLRSMRKVARMAHYLTVDAPAVFSTRMTVLTLLDSAAWTRFGVHIGLFFGTLQGQATKEQFSHWVSKGAIAMNGMAGCFAMTELGHGSNVAGLETTATFDKEHDEFIIHTPTLTATKWWIGGAAQTCTHAAVFAQMIVDGKNYGVKPFIVQLRDPKTFECLPGVVIGDIGAKMGRHGIDNGWIQFTHVHIPRSNLLMKYTKVKADGTVIQPPSAQLAYGALISGRVTMISDSANIAKKALTIAIRYGVVRRQFGGKPGEPETKIMDYVIHQHRLMPMLARAFAMHFTGIEVKKMYDLLMKRLEGLQPKDPNFKDVLESLKELHGTSSGLKAFCTWNALDTIDQCRQACGGHGYSAYTGLAGLYSDFAVQCTWEGDNTILTLQAGRYLIGCYKDSKLGHKQAHGVAYLNSVPSIFSKKCKAANSAEIMNLDMVSEAFSVIAANVVVKAGKDFEDCMQKGLKEEEAYEECSQVRLYAAKIHSFGYLFHRFHDALKSAPQELRQVLSNLCLLYGLYNISELSGAFLQYAYFSPTQMDWIKSCVTSLCKTIRKDAIPLTDSFNFTDFIINSPLGKYNGEVYQAYFNQVVQSHKPGQIPPYFESVIVPLMNRKINEDDDDALDMD